MIDHAALERAFNEYAQALLGPYEIGEVLYRVGDQIVEVLGVDGAGVCVAGEDGLEFVSATDARTVKIEQHQVESSEGPCHTAFQKAERIVSHDLEREERWPAFSTYAMELGFRAVAGLPMPSRERTIGAIDLYRREPHTWSDEELSVAQLLADMASGYIINARQLTESKELTSQLQRALDSRVVIEQAKGIIAGRHDIDMASAFGRIRDHARSNRRSIHDVARDIVERSLQL